MADALTIFIFYLQMDTIAKGFLTALVLGIVCYYLPIWWLVVVAAAVAGFLFPNGSLKSFATGFGAIGLLWLVQSWWISSGNEGMLLEKLSQVLKMGAATIYFITFFIGGLLGGMGFLTGSYLKLAIGADASGRGKSKYRNKYR